MIIKKDKQATGCEDCKYGKKHTAHDGYKFLGCHKKPHKGKPVWEIRECPVKKKTERMRINESQ